MSDQNNQISEFEMALQESFVAESVQVGDVVDGTIAAIHGDVVLVEIGGKSEAVLDRQEIEQPGIGDPVEVVVVSVGDEVRVSHRLAVERRLKERLGQALESGQSVEGKVVGRRKGGFDVNMAGVRGFCPLSQIDDVRSDDFDRHLGETYEFKVLEYSADESKLVVSRAARLREEKERLRREAWERLEEGAVVEGRVRSLTDFGAFVDLGGVDGLVHVTEMSHGRVKHPGDLFAVGDPVTVKVLELDPEKDRISLSVKALQENPWSVVEERFPVRGSFEGQIVRTAPFGAFVELEPGVDGLLHVSQLPPGLELGAEELQVGQTVSGWIKELDLENQRIGLTMRRLPDRDPWERIDMRYQEGQVVDGVVENGADFGVFVELEAGVSALIPISELGLEKNTDPRTAYKPGESLRVKVLSVDGPRQRISVSVRAYKRDLERQDYLKHMDKGAEQPPAMTGFGQQLLNALGKKKKK
jgi:small subunit ribosomal protein S1